LFKNRLASLPSTLELPGLNSLCDHESINFRNNLKFGRNSLPGIKIDDQFNEKTLNAKKADNCQMKIVEFLPQE